MVGRHEWPETGIEGFERGYATVDGVRLHYVSGGRADGEVILLFAGFPQSWYAWRKSCRSSGPATGSSRLICLDRAIPIVRFPGVIR